MKKIILGLSIFLLSGCNNSESKREIESLNEQVKDLQMAVIQLTDDVSENFNRTEDVQNSVYDLQDFVGYE